MVSVSCWVEWLCSASVRRDLLVTPTCLPHASASPAVNLVMEWSWLKADLLALLLFWGYLCFLPPRQERGEGRNESTLQPCQKLFLVAPGHPTHPGYGFIAMDLAVSRSWSEGKAMRWLTGGHKPLP